MGSTSERIASLVARGYTVSFTSYGAKIGATAERIGSEETSIESDIHAAMDRLCRAVDRIEENKDRR